MRKIILYTACSLNGKIARSDGGVDWLEAIPNPEKSDYGYARFFEGVDTTIQGYKTYAQVLGWGIEFPYKGKTNYVLTRDKGRTDTEDVKFITENHAEFVRNLKEQSGNDIWLIGGGQINTLLWNANLIDELIVFIMPIVLEEGIGLFEGKPKEKMIRLTSQKSYASGVQELIYKVD